MRYDGVRSRGAYCPFDVLFKPQSRTRTYKTWQIHGTVMLFATSSCVNFDLRRSIPAIPALLRYAELYDARISVHLSEHGIALSGRRQQARYGYDNACFYLSIILV